MNKTVVLALAAVVATATTGIVSAAAATTGSAPACNYLVGQPGTGKTLLSADNQMDILSADIGSDSANVTVVLRLADLTALDPKAPGGRNYSLQFTAPGQARTLYLTAEVDVVQSTAGTAMGTQTFDFGALVPDGNGGAPLHVSGGRAATGALDYSAHTITLNVPVASWSPLAAMTPGVVLTSVAATATYVIGVAGSGVAGTGNTVKATTGFTLGTPTCVVPGKLS